VFGLEAQGNWADFHGSNVSIPFPAVVNLTRVDSFGLFTGQIGNAWNNVLFYLKGGGALTADRYFGTLSLTGTQISNTVKDTRWGGVVGVGLEYGFAPNWSAAIEYDHLFMQDRTTNFTTPAGAFFTNERIRQDVDLVTARVNYKFGGPIIAKY
jgi:outer membrane immunogenic protein